MRTSGQGGERLAFGEKLDRLKTRLGDPEWRRYGLLLFKGKMLGVGLVFLFMFALNVAPLLPALLGGSAVHAEDVKAAEPLYPAVKPGDIINPLNTLWVLIAAFLVFGMQVGFTMLEAGFC